MFFHWLMHAGSGEFSGRVLDSRQRGCRYPYQRHCVVSLSKTHLSLLRTSSTPEGLSRFNLKIVDWDVKNQITLNLLCHIEAVRK